MSDRPQILVMGGGAAGFFAATVCAETYPSAQITLLEASREVLGKVRISGGGRCNVTHACFEPALLVQSYPRGGKALRGALSRFQPRDTIAWFQKHGVSLKTEADGRMFPTTDDSETIVHCLLQAARRAGVNIRTGVLVTGVAHSPDGFRLTLKTGETLRGDRLLLATGSNPRGHKLAEQLGHSIEPPVPSLFTFNIPDAQLHNLAGVAVEPAKVKLLVPEQKPLEQTGALLITHWGMSGPAILKLSAWGARLLHDQRYRATLQVNWLPQQNPEQLRQALIALRSNQPRKTLASFCPFELPRRLWQYLLDRSGAAPEERWADLSNKAVNQLVLELSQGQYAVQGKGVFKEEFVTCGGVCLKEVDFKTMQSRCCPNLYFAGEILDIDGITGGFNFQSAWTTGWLAGKAMGAPAPT